MRLRNDLKIYDPPKNYRRVGEKRMESKLRLKQKIRRNALVVDDEEINRMILGNILKNDYEITYAADGREALDILNDKKNDISIVLLDILMPRVNGFEVIKEMRADPILNHIPIIVLTSEKQSEIKSLNLGASDFIPKPYDSPEVIKARVNRLVELAEDRRIISDVERDQLTGLYNQGFFLEYADFLIKYKENEARDAVWINIDHFHLINEIYGRDFGDEVLKTLADTLKVFVSIHNGIAGRKSADDFLLFLDSIPDYAELEALLKEKVVNRFPDHNLHIRTGIYNTHLKSIDLVTAFGRAKVACDSLRGNFQKALGYFDDKLQKELLLDERLIHDIHKGLEQKQFIAYFQPKMGVDKDIPYIAGAEALVRLNHPDLGLVPPSVYVDLYEKNGLIQFVDREIWRQAASQIKKWKDEYGITIPISVNASRIDLYDPKIDEHFFDLVKEYDLKPKDLHIEVTETAYAEDANQLIEAVTKLKECGFVIELDDFGTGYSALNMLLEIPIDVLKLDMKFVSSMYDSDKNIQLIKIILDIANMLNVPVVAEGVETEKQMEDLKNLGCRIIQGYYFSKPVAAKEFEHLIKAQKE